MLRNNLRKMKKRYLILILLLLILVIFASKVVLNFTPSMKIGLYLKQKGEIKKGDIVLVCLSEPYKTIGLQHHYIMKGNKCAGTEPLIKKVIAIPNDKVILTDEYLKVNGQKFAYPTYYFDSQNRPLKVFPRGKYQQGYWLIGTNDKRSWDSRYWGFVNRDQILVKLRAFLLW